MKPSFKQFLCLNEDAAAELSALTVQRQQLILKKAATDKQIDTQIAAIDKMIYQKERQKQAEDKKNGMDQQQQQQQQQQQNVQQNPQQRGTQTTTPGSTGSATPGSASSAGNNVQQVA